MPTTSPLAAAAPPIKNPQIILAALAGGVLVFTGVAVALRLAGMTPAPGDTPKLLALALLALVAGEIPLYLMLRRVFLGPVRARRDESLELVKSGRIPLQLQTLAILGAALAEGAGLLGVITVLLGGPWLVLAAPLLAIVLIVLQIPTRARLERAVRG
jgi:hypothetical protein